MYRQGDVLLESIERLGDGVVTEERLLVRGEGRNHGHFIMGDSVTIYKLQENMRTNGGGILTHYLQVSGTAILEHLFTDTISHTKEHLPITIPPGIYRVIRQREYNPYLKAIRAVKD